MVIYFRKICKYKIPLQWGGIVYLETFWGN